MLLSVCRSNLPFSLALNFPLFLLSLSGQSSHEQFSLTVASFSLSLLFHM